MQTGTVLIVDDNKSVLTSLELLLEDEFERVETASNPNSILSVLDTMPVDLVILDMNFSAGVNTGNEGLFWLRRIQEIAPELPVIMLTAYGDVELAVKALKSGAVDFILKPWDNEVLLEKIHAALQAVEREKVKQKTDRNRPDRPAEPAMIIGHSAVMMKLIKVVTKVAKTDANILITGENGTGKEMLAREIHRLSLRSRREMINVDMGAVSESLFESELFGHEKGAFTGAIGERKGYFGEADGGTIFLDEVGELPMSTQARLLRVLESGEFMKVGSSKVQKTDVRVVAATNVNLTQAIAEGRFREDLYYRLNTVPIQIPPLRERGDDVLLLFRKFSADFAEKYRMPAIQLTEDAKKELLAYPWPGNVRQLKNITEQISIIETNREISAAILQNYLPAQNTQRLPALMGTRESKGFESEREILYSVLFDMRQEVAELKKMVHNLMAERAGQVGQVGQMGTVVTTPVVTAHQPSVPAIIHTMQPTVCKDDDDIQDTEEYVEESPLSLDEVEKEMIRKALERHHGKRKSAAKDLNISERTLYRKIKEYELD